MDSIQNMREKINQQIDVIQAKGFYPALLKLYNFLEAFIRVTIKE